MGTLAPLSSQIDVFDLPQLYTRPSFPLLLGALHSLRMQPVSWDPDSSASASFNQFQSRDARASAAAYLTKIVSSSLSWLSADEQTEIWEEAAERLSERCGRTATPAITRTFIIPTSSSPSPPTSSAASKPVTISIHEPSLTGDNLGLKTWGSAYVLASRLHAIGSSYLLMSEREQQPRILELGSGTGLVGLAAAAIWKCHVTLTDLPEIVPNLEGNANRNEDVLKARGGSVDVQELDWSKQYSGKKRYDIIVVADPLYSFEHAPMLAQTIDSYLSNDPNSRVVIEFPIRDEATKTMGDELQSLLSERCFQLLDQGDEYGFDDWEENGERARVHCWWGIWKRC